MTWDKTKPTFKGPLISEEIRNNWDALYTTLSVSHDFTTGLHKALSLPTDGLSVGSVLKMTSGKMLLGYTVDQDGTSLLQVEGTGYFKTGIKFFDGTVQSTASLSTATIAAIYAPLDSPSLTGVPLAPTAAQNTNSTQIATTAYYINQAGTATPLMAGIATAGVSYLFARQDHRHPTDTSNFSLVTPTMDGVADAGDATTYARSNHVHPTDTSRAPLNSPSFTGIPAVPTAALGTNTTQIASTAFVKATIDSLLGAAPGTLDTLQELAAALGDDPNFSTTITNLIATKLSLSGGDLSGVLGIISGTNTSPSLCISGDTNTGLYAPSTDTLAVTLGGISKVVFSPTGDTLQVAGSVSAAGGYVFADGKAQIKAFLGLQNSGTNVAFRNRINITGSYISFSDDSVNDVSTINFGANEGVPVVNYFSGNNSTTTFILSSAPISKDYCCIHIGGTYVPKNQYSLVGTQLTFNTAPAVGTDNIEVEWVLPQAALIPKDNSVTSAMLVDNLTLRGVPTAPTASVGQQDLQIVNTTCLKASLDALGSMAQQNSTDVSVTKIGLALGTVTTPSVYFTGDSNTGLWSPASDTIAVSVAGAEALRITTSGSLLIGRTAYIAGSEKLSIAGTGAFGSASYTIIGDDGTNSIIGSYSNKDLIFKTNNSEVARFTSTGNLIVGTTTDDSVSKLQVAGAASFNTTTYIKLPIGTTAQRPSGSAGFLRYNSDLNKAELHDGSSWGELLTSSTDITESAQDAVAAMFAAGTQTGISFVYDDTNNKMDSTLLGIPATTTVFTASGTWTKPTSGSMAFVQVWGGGGAGNGILAGYGLAAGGGGGAYMQILVPLSQLAAAETVTVGAGGATAGANGGNSSFGAWATANGGKGGGTSFITTTQGCGGGYDRQVAIGGFGGHIFCGGHGGHVSSTADSVVDALIGSKGGDTIFAGAGGGGGGNAITAGGTSLFGGNGSTKGGAAATAPGGGGYSGSTNGAFGPGARGEVRITIW